MGNTIRARLPYMSEQPVSVRRVESAMRSLARAHGLPEPDEVIPGDEHAVLCLWYESRVALVVEPDHTVPGAAPRPATGSSDS